MKCKIIDENGYYFKSYSKNHKELINDLPFFTIIENKQYLYCDLINKKQVCPICYKIKNFDEFYDNKKPNMVKRYYYCKECNSKMNKNRYNNLDIEQKQKTLDKNKIWRKNNIDKVRATEKKRRKNPKTKIISNIRKRLKKEIKFCLTNNPVEGKILDNNSKMLGCSKINFIKYIESLFIEDMSWDNYGIGYKTDNLGRPIYDENGNIIKLKQWHIDHIIPISRFNLEDKKEIAKINHYLNLRPMWSEDNLKKSNSLEENLDNIIKEKYKSSLEKQKIIKKEYENNRN